MVTMVMEDDVVNAVVVVTGIPLATESTLEEDLM